MLLFLIVPFKSNLLLFLNINNIFFKFINYYISNINYTQNNNIDNTNNSIFNINYNKNNIIYKTNNNNFNINTFNINTVERACSFIMPHQTV